ncbi:MAG: hypothetical protein ABI603_04255 [Acidobacteriota bacterium]
MDREIKALLESLDARGVRFELHEDRWRARPRRLITPMEITVLKSHEAAVYRALSAVAEEDDEAAQEPEQQPEQPEEEPEQEVEQPALVTSKPLLLDEQLWEAVGVYRVHGIPTHSRGDQHAEAILSGAVPFETALAERRATTEMLENMRASGEASAAGAIMRRLFG